MLFFEMFSARRRDGIEVSLSSPVRQGVDKPWLNLIRGDHEGIRLPIIFQQVEGRIYSDLIETKHAGLFLISERMVEILSEEKLTGWGQFPISLLDSANQQIFGYAGLSILGRCGPIDLSRSEIISKAVFPGAPITRYFRGKHINPDEWDGNDFFLPEGYYGAFISEKAAKVLKSRKLSNIELKNLAEIEVPEETARMLDRLKSFRPR